MKAVLILLVVTYSGMISSIINHRLYVSVYIIYELITIDSCNHRLYTSGLPFSNKSIDRVTTD